MSDGLWGWGWMEEPARAGKRIECSSLRRPWEVGWGRLGLGSRRVVYATAFDLRALLVITAQDVTCQSLSACEQQA